MVTVRRIRKGEADLFKTLRLEALRESPHAFGTTRESAMLRGPQSWIDQADGTAEGPDRATFIAFVGPEPVGMAALYRDEENAGTGELMQVWVSPAHRGTGAATALVDAVFEWAGNQFTVVEAKVSRLNQRVLGFYSRRRFARSGVDPESGETTLWKQL